MIEILVSATITKSITEGQTSTSTTTCCAKLVREGATMSTVNSRTTKSSNCITRVATKVNFARNIKFLEKMLLTSIALNLYALMVSFAPLPMTSLKYLSS